MAVEHLGQAAGQREPLGIDTERPTGVEPPQRGQQVGGADGRGRVAPWTAGEQVEVDLEVVGEERLGDHRVVDGTRTDQLVDGDEAQDLGHVRGQVVERSVPVGGAVLPDGRDALVGDTVAVEVGGASNQLAVA